MNASILKTFQQAGKKYPNSIQSLLSGDVKTSSQCEPPLVLIIEGSRKVVAEYGHYGTIQRLDNIEGSRKVVTEYGHYGATPRLDNRYIQKSGDRLWSLWNHPSR